MKDYKINIVELFGGIGAIRKALIDLGFDYNVVDYVDINKNAVKAYNTLYNENYEPTSVIGYNLPDEKIDILMHGSPCQDFSVAGKKLGGIKDSGTRSSLLYETVRIVREAKQKPRWIIWENVRGALYKNMITAFKGYVKELDELGYKTTYRVLNSINFGIPQSRERVFAISYLGEENKFNFDNLETKEHIHAKEFLEDNVDEKYTIKCPSMIKNIKNGIYKRKNYVCKVKVIEDRINTITSKIDTLPTPGFVKLDDKYRCITERETFRFMGFKDEDFDKLAAVLPAKKPCFKNRTLYLLAANSIVVDVLKSILKEIKRVDLDDR